MEPKGATIQQGTPAQQQLNYERIAAAIRFIREHRNEQPRLEEVARIDNLSKDERAEYEASLKAYHDNKKVMEYAAALAREEGILIGEERGLKKGRMEGRVEGLLEAAHLMKQNGFSFEQIKLVTCLSDEEIRNL